MCLPLNFKLIFSDSTWGEESDLIVDQSFLVPGSHEVRCSCHFFFLWSFIIMLISLFRTWICSLEGSVECKLSLSVILDAASVGTPL